MKCFQKAVSEFAEPRRMSYFYFVSKSRTQIKIKSNSSKSQTFRSPAEKQKDLGLNGDIKQESLVT